MTVVLALAMVAPSAGFAVSGASSSGTAADAQYPPPPVDPSCEGANSASCDPTPPPRLPFTGSASLLVLALGGALLLGGGVIVRRRITRGPEAL